MLERLMDCLSAVTMAASKMMERMTGANLADLLAVTMVRMMGCLSDVMKDEMMVKMTAVLMVWSLVEQLADMKATM